jgi:hypothetical protein
MVKVMLHATNLAAGSHMEWTSRGRLLISEHAGGRIKDVTDGGDMSAVEPFASGLEGPSGILPLEDGRILVAETWGGRIKDVSPGGDMRRTASFADEMSMPYSMTIAKKNGQKRLFVSECESYKSGWVTDFSEGGGRARQRRYLDGLPVIPGTPGITPINLKDWENEWVNYATANILRPWKDSGGQDKEEHYISIGPLGQILDISEPADGKYGTLVASDRIIAWGLNRIAGIKLHPNNGLLYCTEPDTGSVLAVDPKKKTSGRFLPPVVRGLVGPTCLRFSNDGRTMFVCGQLEGVVWRITDFG